MKVIIVLCAIIAWFIVVLVVLLWKLGCVSSDLAGEKIINQCLTRDNEKLQAAVNSLEAHTATLKKALANNQ